MRCLTATRWVLPWTTVSAVTKLLGLSVGWRAVEVWTTILFKRLFAFIFYFLIVWPISFSRLISSGASLTATTFWSFLANFAFWTPISLYYNLLRNILKFFAHEFWTHKLSRFVYYYTLVLCLVQVLRFVLSSTFICLITNTLGQELFCWRQFLWHLSGTRFFNKLGRLYWLSFLRWFLLLELLIVDFWHSYFWTFGKRWLFMATRIVFYFDG